MKSKRPVAPVAGGFEFIRQTPKGLFIHLRVQPRASRNSVDELSSKTFKIRITAPPVEGEANRAIVEFISELLGVKKSAFSIDAGAKSRDKRVSVEGLTLKELEERFCLSLQKKVS